MLEFYHFHFGLYLFHIYSFASSIQCLFYLSGFGISNAAIRNLIMQYRKLQKFGVYVGRSRKPHDSTHERICNTRSTTLVRFRCARMLQSISRIPVNRLCAIVSFFRYTWYVSGLLYVWIVNYTILYFTFEVFF